MWIAVVLGALIVLALFTTPCIYRLAGNVYYAHHVRVAGDIQTMRVQLEVYHSMNGSFPPTEQGLQPLIKAPTASPQPAQLPKDPWGTSYIYRCPGLKHPSGYDLFSAGPDKRADTADDDWGE